MADPARFPDLTLPFAITGAAAGWLARGLLQHPAVDPPSGQPRVVAALIAAIVGAAAGRLLTRWCAGRRYGYQIDAPDPNGRLPTDRWPRHVAALLAAGTLAGGIAGLAEPAGVPLGLLLGFLCTLPVLPAFAAIVSFARRAQRSRLGSIVAASDRRAVWGVLAIAVVALTLEAIPDWLSPSHPGAHPAGPQPTVALIGLSTLSILIILVLDALALRRVARAIVPGLSPRDDAPAPAEDAAPRLDLGLGEGVHHHVARTGPVYRARERALAIVEGDPRESLAALRQALRRGAFGLAVVVGIAGVHAAAEALDGPAILYQKERCALGSGPACREAARLLGRGTPLSPAGLRDMVTYYQRGCDRGDGPSCLSVAELYGGNEGIEHDMGVVAQYEYRAAQLGFCPGGAELVRSAGSPNVCVPREVTACALEALERRPRRPVRPPGL